MKINIQNYMMLRVWGEHGFLHNLGAVDIAGSGPVHLSKKSYILHNINFIDFSIIFQVGGASAFASAAMLGPRLGRYSNGLAPLPLGNPVNACMVKYTFK